MVQITGREGVLVPFSNRGMGGDEIERALREAVEEIGAEKAEVLRVAKLNIDDNPEVTRKYGVMSIPSLILFVGGEEVARVVGARGKDALLKELDVPAKNIVEVVGHGSSEPLVKPGTDPKNRAVVVTFSTTE